MKKNKMMKKMKMKMMRKMKMMKTMKMKMMMKMKMKMKMKKNMMMRMAMLEGYTATFCSEPALEAGSWEIQPCFGLQAFAESVQVPQ